MLRMNYSWPSSSSLAVILIAFTLPTLRVAQADEIHGATRASRAVGAGRWESTHAAGDKRDWQIEIERFTDDSIAGSIIVIGSPYLHKARIEGRVEGKEVYGVLVGDDDKQVGTFTGTIGDAGLSGTYTTDQGDSGSWSWAGPAGARGLKSEKAESAASE